MIDGVSGSSSQFAAYAAPTASASAPPPPAPVSSAPAPKSVPTGATMPGQTGGGIGDLQSVAPSSIARGQIVDIAA